MEAIKIDKKTMQLGMPIGTASNRLKKKILFSLLKELNKNFCFQCKMEIKEEMELSIEHKIPFLDSENPVNLFFDLDNIAFSHLRCNCINSRSVKQTSVVISENGYKGVKSPSKKSPKYKCIFRHNGKSIILGKFDTAKDAAIAYDHKVIEIFGDSAVTNRKLNLL